MVLAPITKRITRSISGKVTRSTSGWNGMPRNRLLAILGDSITAQNSSATAGFQNYGYVTALNRRTGQRLYFAHERNFGVGGDSTLMAEARIDAMIASGAGVGIIAVGTNDPGLGVTSDQTIDSMKRMKAKAKAAKMTLIFITPAPRGNDAYPDKRLSGALLTTAQTIRSRMLAELPGVGCYVADNHTHLLKGGTTNDIKDGYTSDGLHPITVGAYYWCITAAAIVESIVAPLSVIATVENPWVSGTNPQGSASSNALMSGTTGTVGTGGSGQLATGYSGTNSTGTTGVTRTYSKVNKDGKVWQQVVIGGVAATQNAAIDLVRQISLHTKVTPGLVYEAVAQYEHDADVSNILSLQVGFQLTTPGGTTTLWDGDRYTNASPLPAVADAGVSRSPRFVMPAGATDLRIRVSCYLSTSGAPVGTFRITGVELRPVPGQIPT